MIIAESVFCIILCLSANKYFLRLLSFHKIRMPRVTENTECVQSINILPQTFYRMF